MNSPYGDIPETLPNDFVSHHQCPEIKSYLNIPNSFQPEPVGKKPIGVRWSIGPLCLERYVSNEEPNMHDSCQGKDGGRARLVLWYRLGRNDQPAGWLAIAKKGMLEGFAEIKPGQDYAAKWSQSARRYRNHWSKYADITHALTEVSIDEFADAYRNGTVHKNFGASSIEAMRRKYTADKQGISLRAIRELRTGKLLAGMGTIDAPLGKISFYECGFVVPNADPSFMTALMDDWFSRSQKNGLKFLHFGVFWSPGSPRAWRGFSLFKSKFCSQYTTLQPVIFRFVRGKLW